MAEEKMKVLICDDSMLMRKKLKEALAKCGDFEIFEATDGENAVNIYKEVKPELVFMDIVMPKKDGIQAVKEIRTINKHAKVVMASSSGTQTHLKKAIEAGASDFIQKPWEQHQITAIVEAILKERA